MNVALVSQKTSAQSGSSGGGQSLSRLHSASGGALTGLVEVGTGVAAADLSSPSSQPPARANATSTATTHAERANLGERIDEVDVRPLSSRGVTVEIWCVM